MKETEVSDQMPSDLDIQTPKRAFWRNFSPLWAVPVISLVLALGLAWQSYSDRGTRIEILFDDASGITAGETLLKFRDVTIGEVEELSFTGDLTRVIVTARVHRSIAAFLDEDTTWWIVQPEVSAQGISGLSTVLSGVYIQGSWDEEIRTVQTRFEGSTDAPAVLPGYKGKRVTLRATDGEFVSSGAPIFYRGIHVGRLGKPRLTTRGDSILVDAYINEPHDALLNSATRFWDTSGFSVTLGAGGISLDVESIATLLTGGIAFDSVFENAAPVHSETLFDIYEDEAEARKSIFVGRVQNGVTVSVAFGESVSGLTPGAAVQFGGIEVGEVTEIRAEIQDESSDQAIVLMASLNLDPLRLGLPNDATPEETISFLQDSVSKGMRARLATTSLFSSSLVVNLVMLEDAEPAEMDIDARPFPVVPSVRSDLPDFTATAEGVLERINALPIEELLNQGIETLAGIEDLVTDPDIRSIAPSARSLLDDTNAWVNGVDVQALPADLRAAVNDLQAITQDLRTADVTGSLSRALAATETTANNLSTATEDLPELVAELRELTAKANGLEAEALVAQATQFLTSADAVINTDGARALPPTLTAALEEVRLAVSELREGGAVNNLNAALASAEKAASSIDVAADDFRASVKDLPELSRRLQQLVDTAEEVISSYGNRSTFSDETLIMLRDVSDAARAVESLSRQLERNPSSLITGR